MKEAEEQSLSLKAAIEWQRANRVRRIADATSKAMPVSVSSRQLAVPCPSDHLRASSSCPNLHAVSSLGPGTTTARPISRDEPVGPSARSHDPSRSTHVQATRARWPADRIAQVYNAVDAPILTASTHQLQPHFVYRDKAAFSDCGSVHDRAPSPGDKAREHIGPSWPTTPRSPAFGADTFAGSALQARSVDHIVYSPAGLSRIARSSFALPAVCARSLARDETSDEQMTDAMSRMAVADQARQAALRALQSGRSTSYSDLARHCATPKGSGCSTTTSARDAYAGTAREVRFRSGVSYLPTPSPSPEPALYRA
ncbi:hypothetical protein E5Q_03929 [Mixia osmundae IAM 14324]|uniref:Uncharacterized protein n=2 Tax=Mixia osmundae (strain CBS 9802 / IAM 14324 / JCM 22182 / KY 12970) TaxID=764103 RepID=G7E371_MIXOS|nr:hypothetical protein E5Q_03929 [Mixia osmundae IAM 14324]